MTGPGKTTSESCIICQNPGFLLRVRDPIELATSYNSYFGVGLPKEIVEKYFVEPASEYLCRSCGIRWYLPDRLGETDYYAILASNYPWYYGLSWDKEFGLELLAKTPNQSIVEIGCGDGLFLENLKKRGLTAIGVDINETAIQSARNRGLAAYLPHERPEVKCDILCLFQTIEHVSNPTKFLQDYINQYQPREVLLAAPCFESILGRLSDPLSWPPHHRTAWSEKGFQTLASRVGLKLKNVWYQPTWFDAFQDRQRAEPSGSLLGLPHIPNNWCGKLIFRIARRLGCSWANRSHTILALIG